MDRASSQSKKFRPSSSVGARWRGFSLIELVIVVVIMGIIGAIAIPRMSRGTEAAQLAALTSDLQSMRNAIELYKAEHGGLVPLDDDVTEQLLGYTDIHGNISPSGEKTGEFCYGPYLRSIPPLPVGIRRGNTGMHWTDAAGVGWLYSQAQFTIKAHASGEFDSSGIEYSEY